LVYDQKKTGPKTQSNLASSLGQLAFRQWYQ